MKRSRRALLLAMLAVAVPSWAQAPAPAPVVADERVGSSTLRTEIEAADSALFGAFNRRDVTALMSFFTRDVEFYQDNEGVADYAQTERDFGKMFGQAALIRRALVPGSLEVFPIKNYG